MTERAIESFRDLDVWQRAMELAVELLSTHVRLSKARALQSGVTDTAGRDIDRVEHRRGPSASDQRVPQPRQHRAGFAGGAGHRPGARRSTGVSSSVEEMAVVDQAPGARRPNAPSPVRRPGAKDRWRHQSQRRMDELEDQARSRDPEIPESPIPRQSRVPIPSPESRQNISPNPTQNHSRAFCSSERRRHSASEIRVADLRSCSKSSRNRPGEIAAAHGDVQLVVELERAVVEVGGAEHAPDAVDHQHLRVHHRRLVLVDLDALLQETFVGVPRRVLHRHRIGDVAFDQEPDLHTATHGIFERPHRRFVGDEVRRRDLDRLLRRREAEEIEKLQVVAAAGR